MASPNNRALAGKQAADATGAEASDQNSNTVAGTISEWINQQQRSAGIMAPSDGAPHGSIPYEPAFIGLPGASRESELDFFDFGFGHQPQPDTDAEAQINSYEPDSIEAMNLETESEQQDNFGAHGFDETSPDATETSKEIVEEQNAAVLNDTEPFEPNLVPEDEIYRSPYLPRDLEVSGSGSAQDPITPGSEPSSDSTPRLVHSQVPGVPGAGPQHTPIVAGVHIVGPASAVNNSGSQVPMSNAQNAPSMTGAQQPPASTNTGARKGKYVPKIQTRPPRTRGPLQSRPIPLWPEFIHVTPAVRSNAAGHEAALQMITHARNVPGLRTVGNTDLITSSIRRGDTPGDWKPVVIANFLNEWIFQNYNGLVLWSKQGKIFREQINWYDRRPLMEQANIRRFITQQVEALLPAADQQRIAQLRQNFQSPSNQLTVQVANGTWQPPMFGPPSAAFLAQVAARDTADAAAAEGQANSGTQMSQMGPGVGGGPVVGTGGVPNSSQPPAGIGGSGASSSAVGGFQAPHSGQSNSPQGNRKRDRDDAEFDDGDNISNSRDLPAPPRSKKPRQGEHSGGLASQNMARERTLSSSNMFAQLSIQGEHRGFTAHHQGPMGNAEHQIRGSTSAQGGSRTDFWNPASGSLDDSANMIMYDNMPEGIVRQNQTPGFDTGHESWEDIAERTRRPPFAAGMYEQSSHQTAFEEPYPVEGAHAQTPYYTQPSFRQQAPYEHSARRTYDAPHGRYGQQQYPPQQLSYSQPAPQHYGSTALASSIQPSNPTIFDFSNLDPALFGGTSHSSGSNLPTDEDSLEASDEVNIPADIRRWNAQLIDEEEEAERISAYWRNEENRARGGLAARPEVFGLGLNGPSRDQRGSSLKGTKRRASGNDEEDGDDFQSGQERPNGKRNRRS